MDITYNDFKGIGINFKTALRSYHDFKDILDRTGDADMVEAIIQSVLVFRTDKKMLRRWLKRNTHGLTEGDIKMICGLQYQEWGTLSQTFLTEIYSPDENGEAKTIMDCLRDTDCDLAQLMSEDFQFAEQAQAHLDALFGCGQTLDQQLIERRIPAALRRSIRQTLRIVDEIADMEKSAPKKIFLEVDNGNGLATKTRRTVNRKDELIALYKGCHETDSELYEQLVSEDEDSLRSNKLYLYYDQFGKCMYSGESIDREVLMQGGTYDIDHIIPQSKLRDHTMYNLVLVKSQLNREKADNYPIKAEIRQKMRRFWSRLRTQNMISKEKYDRLIRGTDLLRSELTRFVARQLNQNRNCVNMLTSLLEEAYGVTEIVYSKADNVADFRHRFGFVRCPNVNDLYHAKDAYLNIVVGNVYHCKFAPQFFANIENETYSLNRVFDFDTPGAWKTEESIQIVKRTMAKNNVRTTRMPHETTGALYKLQVLPAGKGQLEKKQGLDIQRYGGYDKLTGAYFFLVEHTSVRKGRMRTIESVYLCQKTAYEQDPIAYCTDVLHLKDPVIIAPKILVDAVLELNGARFNIAWRTSDDIVFRHTCQLIVDRETQQYINDLVKYNDHCNARGEKLPVTAFDGISAEKNLAFYELLTQKCGENAYRSCFSAFSIMGSEMGSSKQVFAAMSVRKQVAMLLEVLNAFRCNTTNANFKELSGKTARGLVFVRKNMSNMSSAYLVHQSVTGLYEYKTDLLK
jgi:CRISPR-associated endonuclease Csn1